MSAFKRESKEYLKSSERIHRILNHRSRRLNTNHKMSVVALLKYPDPKPFVQSILTLADLRANGLTETTLRDLEANTNVEDGDGENPETFIRLTIIDEPVLETIAIQFLVEDRNKDLTILEVFGLPLNQTTVDAFPPGMVILVARPSFKKRDNDELSQISSQPLIEEGNPWIQVDVDQLDTIIRLRKKIKICRYCGNESAPLICVHCKCAYCTQECQLKDHKELKHNWVCETNYKVMSTEMDRKAAEPESD